MLDNEFALGQVIVGWHDDIEAKKLETKGIVKWMPEIRSASSSKP